MWSILEKVGECRWERKGYLWIEIDVVRMECNKEKEYNEVVEEVVKRLVKNNLYIKLEKCKWRLEK